MVIIYINLQPDALYIVIIYVFSPKNISNKYKYTVCDNISCLKRHKHIQDWN